MSTPTLRSHNWFGKKDLDGFSHRSWIKAEGFSELMARPVLRNGAVTMAMAGTPCSSIRIASSTLLELHDPQSPMPEMTRSHCARSALIASPSTS